MGETFWVCEIIEGHPLKEEGDMSDEVLAASRLLFSPGQVVEVRVITDDGMASDTSTLPMSWPQR